MRRPAAAQRSLRCGLTGTRLSALQGRQARLLHCLPGPATNRAGQASIDMGFTYPVGAIADRPFDHLSLIWDLVAPLIAKHGSSCIFHFTVNHSRFRMARTLLAPPKKAHRSPVSTDTPWGKPTQGRRSSSLICPFLPGNQQHYV